MTNVKKIRLSDLIQLKKNPNLGSERGNALLRTSFEKGGVGRSILFANNGEILAGNHAAEVYGQLFDEQEVLVVETDGKQLVAVKRTDIPDSDDERAKALIIGDNRTSDFHEYDANVIADLLESDQDILKSFFYDWELDKLIHEIPDELTNPEDEWRDMPEFEQESKKDYHTIKVCFRNEHDMNLFSEILQQTITDKTTSVYYPKQERRNLKNIRLNDES